MRLVGCFVVVVVFWGDEGDLLKGWWLLLVRILCSECSLWEGCGGYYEVSAVCGKDVLC